MLNLPLDHHTQDQRLEQFTVNSVENKLNLTSLVQGRILVMRLDNIGDVVMLSPALRALRDAFPQAEIVLLASPAGSQVSPLLPWVDEVISLRPVWQDVSGALPFDPQRELELVERLRQRRFDAAFIFTSFNQSPFPPAYVCYLAGIPVRIGHSKEFGGRVLTHCNQSPPDDLYQVERNLSLLKAVGIPIQSSHIELHIPTEVQSSADEILHGAGINPQQVFIVLAPGASCAARRYNAERYADAARLLAAKSGIPIVIVGSARETELIQPVIASAADFPPGQVVSLVGKTSVPELADIVRRASLVIANNSASLHFVEAYERPMLILYSGTDYESQWKPYFAPTRILRRETACSPCYRFQCPYLMECLDIAPEEVATAAIQMLEASLASPAQRLGLEETVGQKSS